MDSSVRLSGSTLGWTKRKTILVVDDDPDLRLGLEIRLKANGFTVVMASDGEESILAAAKYAPDLILLDLGLPRGDGYSVMQQLSESQTMRLIPVIVLSARELRPNRDRSLQDGAFTFLQKPAETADLIDAIRRALGQGKKKPARAERELQISESQNRMMDRILSRSAQV